MTRIDQKRCLRLANGKYPTCMAGNFPNWKHFNAARCAFYFHRINIGVNTAAMECWYPDQTHYVLDISLYIDRVIQLNINYKRSCIMCGCLSIFNLIVIWLAHDLGRD